MKKILVAILSAAILFSVASATAFTEEEYMGEMLSTKRYDVLCDAEFDTVGSNPDADTGFYDPDTVVAVNVTWSDTNFLYDFGENWDPNERKYIKQPGWDKDYVDVIVTNHSNCPVDAEVFITDVYTPDTKVSFADDKSRANLTSAINEQNVADGKNSALFKINFDYTPQAYVKNIEDFFSFEVKISGADS